MQEWMKDERNFECQGARACEKCGENLQGPDEGSE